MMTVEEIISQTKQGLRLVNADARYPNKYIWSVIASTMRTLIMREGDKLDLIKLNYLFQTKKCVQIAEAPAIDECCGIKSRCTVWRSIDKLPKMFQDSDGYIIKNVYSIDGSSDYSIIKPEEFVRKLENPHTLKYDKTKYCYVHNEYIYFPTISRTSSPTRMAMVRAYFEDAITNSCDGTVECIPKIKQVAYFPEGLESVAIKEAVVGLAQISLRVPEDTDINKNPNRKN